MRSSLSRLLSATLVLPSLLGLFSACGRERAPAPAEQAESLTEAAYDVVVVGGGLAGLRAAYGLQDKRVLLLEREPRLGGRVFTKVEGEARYELGAIFGYDPRLLPRGSRPSQAIPSRARIGYSEAGVTAFADTAAALVDELEGRSTGAARTTRHLAARRALFGVIHQGAYDEYIYERQGDWRVTFDLSRTQSGNGELVEALALASGAEIALGAEVSRVEERGEQVSVAYTEGDEAKTVTAHAAIVATPADVATRLLGPLAEGHPVSRIRYAPGVVVALGVREDTLAPFSYVVSEDAGLSAVLSQSLGDLRVLTIYYARDDIERARSLDDEALVRQTLDRLGELGIGELAPEDVRFSDVHRWEAAGTIIAEDSYSQWNEASAHLTDRIFLAGDYTHWDERMMPYGMAAAAASGGRAAERVRALLLEDAATSRGDLAAAASITPRETAMVHARIGLVVPKPSTLPPLTTCEVFELQDDAPRYLGRVDEGSVAPYGLVLLGEAGAEREKIVGHLQATAVKGLWEYSPGHGVTSADSALVLEGLLAAGAEREQILGGLELLRERYFDPAQGGFSTAQRGRARYWSGPSADSTAVIAHLMHQVAPERFAEELEAAARYLLAQQNEDGLFPGRRFASWVLPTSYALRFLAQRPDPQGELRLSIRRATRALAELQREDGSVGGSVTETALLAMTFAVTRDHPEALARARAWLTEALERGVPAGDGFLYYWFEHSDGTRAFFDCRDRGRIAEALARAALRRSR